MSFVLDALRRADAERERGAVPDLHAHEAPGLGGADTPAASARGVLVWVLGAAALALLVTLGVVLWPRGDEPVAATAPSPTPTPMPVAPAAAVATPAPAPAPTPAAAPAAPQVVIRIETPAAPAPAPNPAPVRDKARETAREAARATAPAAQPAPVKWKDLSEAQRREIPKMAFGGAMDSPVPANRMLVINGRVVREGEEAERGVVLERIRLNAAVLRYKDLRFEVSY